MLFDRVYRLLVGKKGSNSGLEITELRIQFKIEKTAKKNPNSNSIKIWNLKKETRAELEKPDTRCVLYAGYAEDAGPLLIFNGGVTFAWSSHDGPDIITEFELGDGAQEIRDTTVSLGYGKNIKSTQILNDVAKKMGTPLTLPSNAPERSWLNGLSYFGSARTLLDKVTKGSGLEWSIQNGNLQVIQKGMVTTRQGVLISADSGMIKSPERDRAPNAEVNDDGSPKKKRKSKTTVAKDEDGWKVKTLLMPTLNPGDRVELEALEVNGVFRIQELTHTGDSHEGDWQTEMKLVDTSAPIADQAHTKGGPAKRAAAKPQRRADAPVVSGGFA